jgi:hypothetical protein
LGSTITNVEDYNSKSLAEERLISEAALDKKLHSLRKLPASTAAESLRIMEEGQRKHITELNIVLN